MPPDLRPDLRLLVQGVIPMAQLREYIAYARAKCKPELTDAAAAALIEGYIQMRSQGVSRKVPGLKPVCNTPRFTARTHGQDFPS